MALDGPPVLASSSTVGSIAMWDLSKGGRIIHTHRRAHEQSIASLEWVVGQPLLISSSVDNSVKVRGRLSHWIARRLIYISNGYSIRRRLYHPY
jgi:WD40 repeat protein